MSPTGEAEDTFASRAKPRRVARVCECGWHPTLGLRKTSPCTEGARSARRRAIAHAADAPAHHGRGCGTEAVV